MGRPGTPRPIIAATHPQVKIPGRGGKLPGTYHGRRGPCPLRGLETVANRSVPMPWPKRGPGPSRSWGQRRSAWRTLAGKADPRRLPPTSEPARAIALLGGALAGSGPGTSPCIDGLSLVTGMVVPQRPAYPNHAHDGGCWTTGHDGGGMWRPLAPGVMELVRGGWRGGIRSRLRPAPTAEVPAMKVR
jgi:hypothetical protein